MPATCSTCHLPATHYKQRLLPSGAWQTICSTCANPQHSVTLAAANPLSELVLEHVLDESGAPVRVTSLRQLRAAEQRYAFRSVVGNEDSANFDTPPSHGTGDLMKTMSDEGKWLYPEIAEEMVAEMRAAGELD